MITAIIQARMGSSRLPDKTLMEIMGKPMLWHLIERVRSSRYIDNVVIATTNKQRDDLIVDFAKRCGIAYFRGSENDVLDRFYRAAVRIKPDAVVRVTPDCPLMCPEVIDKVTGEYMKGGYDYVTNTLVYTYPDGCDVEVFSYNALEKSWKECSDPVEREHVTLYIRNSGKFRLKNVLNENPVDPKKYKWSVDRAEDMEFVRKVYSILYKPGEIFTMRETMELLKKQPEIKHINSGAVMNEGYYRSFVKLPKIKAGKLNIKKSLALKKKAEKLVPSCSQTFSKGPTQFVQGVAPVFLEQANGCHVWDVDGNKFIDYAMALGPIILGHNYPAVNEAVNRVMKKGVTFSLPHRMEIELSEMLTKIIPCAEMVRFGKNGSDVTSGAVRAARAFTGREKVACCGYHGWQDWYIATTTRDLGIPRAVKNLTMTFGYNDIESLEKLFSENKNQIACVIMEATGIVEPKDGFLKAVKELAHKNGALLVFDEVVTGFRLSMGGAQEYFNVIPDMACFGKAMGNGFPIAAVVGRKNIMKIFDEIFYSFTLGGEIVSIAAAIATINELKNKKVIPYIREQGRKIKDGYNVIAAEFGMEKYTRCIGYPPRNVITFKNEKGEDDLILKSLFQQECLKRGILFTGGHNVCFSHTGKDIDYTLRVYRTVLELTREAITAGKVKKLLEGKPVQPVFRKA